MAITESSEFQTTNQSHGVMLAASKKDAYSLHVITVLYSNVFAYTNTGRLFLIYEDNSGDDVDID